MPAPEETRPPGVRRTESGDGESTVGERAGCPVSPGVESEVGSGFHDRRTALLVVGILEIVLGACAWLMCALMVLGATMAARQGGASVASMIPGMASYFLAGVVFMILGAGSIKARRWARALWLVVGTSWLLVGILGIGMAFLILPGILQGSQAAGGGPAPPEGVLTIVVLVTVGFLSIFMVAVPLALVLFYRSPHVRATCEAVNPWPCWTDRRPLPVLGAALWLGVMALSLPAMAPVYGGLYPAFGRFIGGPAGYALWIGSGLLAGVAAVGVFQRRMPFWWLAFLLVAVQGVSTTLTYAVADLRPLFEGMGVKGDQLVQLERMNLLSPGYMVATTLSAVLPLLGLLLWARTVLPEEPGLDTRA